MLRQTLGDEGLIVTPGIRPGAHDDDQKRAVTPRQALMDGADFLVVGRPIRDAADPRQSCNPRSQSLVSHDDPEHAD